MNGRNVIIIVLSISMFLLMFHMHPRVHDRLAQANPPDSCLLINITNNIKELLDRMTALVEKQKELSIRVDENKDDLDIAKVNLGFNYLSLFKDQS